MIPIIFERFLASLAFITLFAVLVKSIGFFRQWRMRKHSIMHILPISMKTDKPTLLYFWSTGCLQCKPQEYHIEQAKATLLQTGKTLKVLKLNALKEQKLAELMNVMTVPTTVLLDSQGKIAAWNQGLTHSMKIIEQYRTIEQRYDKFGNNILTV